ncbi:MAG: molecular chaperone DnaJ [Hyphomonadaceae bacterium]
MTTDRDYYDVLGVPRGADPAALKNAYRKLAKEYHPDREGGCEEKFKELNEAYAILSDPEKRSAYDRFGKAGVNGGAGAGFTDFSDIFSEVFGDAFGDFFGARGRRGPPRGADLRYDMEITLEQAFLGVEREFEAPGAALCEKCEGSGAAEGARPETCPTCGGAGHITSGGMFRVMRTCPGCGGAGQAIRNPCRSCGGRGVMEKRRKLSVKIPPGVEDGMRIRLAGEGDAAPRGGHPGDLYIFLSVRPHQLFERNGSELFCRATVPMTTAALGGEVEIPTICGANAKVAIPEGAQTGRRIRVKGMGMSSVQNRDRGDLHVELAVETPVKLNAKQKKLLQEFAGLCGDDSHPQSHGFRDLTKRIFHGSKQKS